MRTEAETPYLDRGGQHTPEFLPKIPGRIPGWPLLVRVTGDPSGTRVVNEGRIPAGVRWPTRSRVRRHPGSPPHTGGVAMSSITRRCCATHHELSWDTSRDISRDISTRVGA